jgi:hypothetical protein
MRDRIRAALGAMAAGASQSEAARRHGVHRDTLRRAMLAAGMPPMRAGSRPKRPPIPPPPPYMWADGTPLETPLHALVTGAAIDRDTT